MSGINQATCRNQTIQINCVFRSINQEPLASLLYTWSLPWWIWQSFELPVNRVPPQHSPAAVSPSDLIIYRLIVAVLSQLLHFPRNPRVCLCPQLPAGTPLRRHPMESWGRGQKGSEQRAVLLRQGHSDMTAGSHLACADQFVVFELSQLSSQSQVRVHQEGLSATLIEILER